MHEILSDLVCSFAHSESKFPTLLLMEAVLFFLCDFLSTIWEPRLTGSFYRRRGTWEPKNTPEHLKEIDFGDGHVNHFQGGK